MRYILTSGWEDGIADLTRTLAQALAEGKKVLWLTSGGSNIPASVEVMDKISADLSKNLSVSLADERYGDPDYPDSNWTKLLGAGFDSKNAKLLPILRENQTFEQAQAYYEKIISEGLRQNDIVIAQLGVGDDGHIAGILPDSPAAAEESSLICGYQSQPFLRLTLTFPALQRIDIAYTFAFGNTKRDALTTLRAKKISQIQQPAQVLKKIPQSYLYSDQVGEPT